MSEKHDDLSVMSPGHQRGRGGVGRRGGEDTATKEFVGGHGEKDVLVVATTEEEHATRGVEAELGVFSPEGKGVLLEVHLEREPVVGEGVRKKGGKAHAIGDGEVIVYHRFLGVHEDLTGAEGNLELVVYVHVSTRGEEVDGGGFLVNLVKVPELRELEPSDGKFFETFARSFRGVVRGLDDAPEYGGLVDRVSGIGGQFVWHQVGEVEGNVSVTEGQEGVQMIANKKKGGEGGKKGKQGGRAKGKETCPRRRQTLRQGLEGRSSGLKAFSFTAKTNLRGRRCCRKDVRNGAREAYGKADVFFKRGKQNE